ncbi:MAG: O-antigen ligase family protein [Aquisalimonadaceae bacterium]
MNLAPPKTLSRFAPGMAAIGLFGAALLAGISWIGFLLATALVALATALNAAEFRASVRGVWLVRIALALTAYILVQTPLAIYRYPLLAGNHYPDWTDLLAISGMASVTLGWWIARFPHLVPRLLAITGAGMAGGVLMGIQWANLMERGMGARRDWGYLPEEVGLFAGMILLGSLVMFLHRLGIRSLSRRQRFISGLCWLAAAAAAGTVLYGTQTRALWIGSATLTLIYVVWHLSSAIRQRTGTRTAAIAALVITVTLGGLIQLDGAERLERRLDRGGDTIAALIALDREGVLQANPSLGERLNMWVEAMRAFTHHPVMGWGIGAKVVTDELAELHVGWRQPHYHNLYLEFLLGLGLIGFGLFIALCVSLIQPLLHRPRAARPVHHILVLTMTLTAFAFLFELQVGNASGRAVTVWLMALLASLVFLQHRKSGS